MTEPKDDFSHDFSAGAPPLTPEQLAPLGLVPGVRMAEIRPDPTPPEWPGVDLLQDRYTRQRLLDEFATAAMSALVAEVCLARDDGAKRLASRAYAVAEAMLAERDRRLKGR